MEALGREKLGRTGLGRVRWGQYTEGHFLESQDKALKRTTHARCRANGQTGQGRAGKRQTGQGNISKGGQAAQPGKKHIAQLCRRADAGSQRRTAGMVASYLRGWGGGRQRKSMGRCL